MTKANLIDVVSEKTGLNKTESKSAVETTLEAIKSGVYGKGKLQLQGFGTFKVVTRKARTGRNPQTGETIQIAEKKVVKFNPSF